MTQQEARALVRKECRRRQRKGKRGAWGAENTDAIRAMRDELTWLHAHPSQARRLGSTHFGTRTAIPGIEGGYINHRWH